MVASMEGPRPPVASEWSQILEFLNKNLRSDKAWSITNEYPTALHPTNLHNIRIVKQNNDIVSHAVVKPLVIKSPHVIYKVAAIGSVVTDEGFRKQGLSTKILQNCLDASLQQNCDIAILWTNMHDFYRKMGFELAGSEISFLIDQNLTDTASSQFRFSADPKVAAESIHRLYSLHTVGTARTLEETRKFLIIPETKLYTAWDSQNQLVAYAIEGKGADLGGYIHEWGGSTTGLLSLLSWIRHSTGQNKTIIVPQHSLQLIEKLRAKNLIQHNGFLGMIKLLQFDQLATKIKRAFRAEGIADFVLEKRDGLYYFGLGQELVTLSSEQDVVRLLFGPIDYQALGFFKEENIKKMQSILPLKFWVWGWDSV